MKSFILAGATAAAILLNASTASADCGGSLAAVLGWDTAAGAALVDVKARFNMPVPAGAVETGPTALQLTLLGNAVFLNPVQSRAGFGLGLCHRVTEGLDVTVFGNLSWNFPNPVVRLVLGGEARLDVGHDVTVPFRLTGRWEDWVFAATKLEFSAEVPVGAARPPVIVLVPSLALEIAGGTATTEIGMTIVRPLANASLIASVGHTIGGGWSFALGVDMGLPRPR